MRKLNDETNRKRKKKFKVKFKTKPDVHVFIKEIRKNPPRIFYSVKDVCAVLSLGRTSVFALLAQNKLESVVYGRRRLIYRHSVKEYAASLHQKRGVA